MPKQRDDERLPAMVLLPVLSYAERYPALPVFTIVECLLDAWRDAALTYIDDDWMGSFDGLVTGRLDALAQSSLGPPDPAQHATPRPRATPGRRP